MTTSARHGPVLLVVCAAAVLGATACSGRGATTVHPRTIEREVARGYEAQVPGSTVSKVRCPRTIPSAVGTRVRCALTLSTGVSGPVEVQVLDRHAHVRWTVLPASEH